MRGYVLREQVFISVIDRRRNLCEGGGAASMRGKHAQKFVSPPPPQLNPSKVHEL